MKVSPNPDRYGLDLNVRGTRPYNLPAVISNIVYIQESPQHTDLTHVLIFSYHLGTMSSKGTSVLRERNAATKQRSYAAVMPQIAQMGWLEKKIKPTKISARYPVKGTPLLYATCAFGSLGDALFGYNSGVVSATR